MKAWRFTVLIAILVAWLALPGSTSPVSAASPTVPAAPLNVHASLAGTAGSATVTWLPPNNGGMPITAYMIRAYPGSSTTAVAIVYAFPSATSATVEGLVPGSTYTFTVAAFNALGWGPESARSSALPVPAVPRAPTNVQAMKGTLPLTATVSWTRPVGASVILGYRIEVYQGPGSTWVKEVTAPGTATSATVTGLTAGGVYTFTVSARNAAGWGVESAPSAPLAFLPPTPGAPWAPTSVQAVAGPTAGSATVIWAAPYNGGSPIIRYLIRAYIGSSSTVVKTAYAGASATSLTVIGLSGGRPYTFTVTAQNAVDWGVESDPSGVLTLPSPFPTVPWPPTNVQATAGPTVASATVTWTTPYNGGSTITGYEINAYLGSNPTPVASAYYDAPFTHGNAFTITGLTAGGSYTFTVAAENAVGLGPESAPSVAIGLLTVPGAPANVSAVAGSAAGSATISWTAPSNGGSPILGYRIQAYLGSGTTSVATAYPGPSATSFTMTGLSSGVAYTFTVAATNAVGWGSESARSVSISLYTVPGAPTSVQAVTDTTSVAVSWYAPSSNGGSPITGYVITAATGNPAETVTASVPGWALSTTLTQLIPGKIYVITVKAVNSIGSGPTSLATSPVTLPTVPGAPLNLSTSPNGSTLQVTWLAPSFNGGKPVTGYTATFSDGVHTPTSQQVTGTSATFTGLPTGTTYTVAVTASNVVGAGPAATTPATLPSLPPSLAVPTGTAAHHGDQVSFAVTATSPQPADHLVLTATGLPAGVTFTDLGNGTGKVSGNAEVAAGIYPVTFAVSNGHNAPVLEKTTIAVTRETAAVDPALTNPVNVAIAKTTGVSGTVILRANLHELYDADGMADIGEAAPVTYTLTPLGGGQTYTYTANLNGGGIGAELKTNAVFGHLPTNVYAVTVSVGGNFYQGSAVTLLTVYNPAVHASVTGKGAVTAGGVPWTFQFHAAYGKGGKLSGTATFTEQPHLHIDTTLPLDTSLTLHTLKGKVSGQVVVKNHRAYFQGLATINGVAGYRFVVTVVDNDYRAAPDLIGLQVIDPQHASVPALSFAPSVLSSGHAAFKR
jgi:titin